MGESTSEREATRSEARSIDSLQGLRSPGDGWPFSLGAYSLSLSPARCAITPFVIQVFAMALGVFLGLLAFALRAGFIAICLCLFGVIGQHKESEKRIREAAAKRVKS